MNLIQKKKKKKTLLKYVNIYYEKNLKFKTFENEKKNNFQLTW